MRRLGLAFVTGMWLVACDDGGSTGSGGSAGSTTSSDSTSSSGGGGAGGVATGGGGSGGVATGGGGSGGVATGGGGAGGGTSTGGGGPVGACGRRCTQDSECCPDGVMGCPGAYPLNFKCADLDGDGEMTCRTPECATDAECNPGGATSYVCKSIANFAKACILACQVDADCAGTTKCIGLADDGTKYCSVESQPFTCTPAGGECTGYGVCADSGDKCVCMADDQCDDAGYAKDCVNVGN